MPERLGEMLLQVGALTEAQLEEVLSAQSIYGGRLGTNLVEMGLLSEEELARLLNQKLGVPSVDAASLERVPDALISLIPQDMVRRFKVLPVALDGKRLTLAMADPSDFRAIEELGFFTGMVIVPRVCSELRLSLALERFYGIKRSLHFIPVAGGVRTRMITQTRENAGLAPPALSLATVVTPEPGRGPGAAPSPHPGACAGAPADPEPGTGAEPAARRLSMEAIAGKLATVSGEAEVVTTLMGYLKEEFDRAGFLSLRRGSALGVQAVADRREISGFAGCLVGLEHAPLLKQVLEERTAYLGRFPEKGAEARILKSLGGKAGAQALLLPLAIGGQSVALLVVEDDSGRLGTGLGDLRRVAAKAELAFEMLGIRKKIGLV